MNNRNIDRNTNSLQAAEHPGSLVPFSNLPQRKRAGKTWQIVFLSSTIIGILSLTALLLNILDQSFGYVVLHPDVDPSTFILDGVPLEGQTKDQLVSLFKTNISSGAYQ